MVVDVIDGLKVFSYVQKSGFILVSAGDTDFIVEGL